MVTNFRHDRLLKERRQKIYGALFLIVTILILGRGPIFSFLGRVGHFVGIPIWKANSVFVDSADYASEYARPKSVLINELLSLRREVESNKSSSVIIETLKVENKNIKQILGREDDAKRILSRVISRPPMQVYDTLVIDVGEKNGIAVGDMVYANGEYLIGKVSRAYTTTSVVTLSSSPLESHSVMVNDLEGREINLNSSSSKTSLLHSINFQGIGGGGFHSQIPKHLDIATGTPMVLSTINPSIIGIITGENVPDSGSLKDVYGSLPFSINSIDWVYIEVK